MYLRPKDGIMSEPERKHFNSRKRSGRTRAIAGQSFERHYIDLFARVLGKVPGPRSTTLLRAGKAMPKQVPQLGDGARPARPDLLNKHEAACYLRCSIKTLDGYAADGSLRYGIASVHRR